MLTALIVVGWLLLGFIGLRGWYATMSEYTSLGGPAQELPVVILTFILGPLCVLAWAVVGVDRKALKHMLFINNTSPAPKKCTFVHDDLGWGVTVSEAEFAESLEKWDTVRKALLFKPWTHVEVEPDPFRDFYATLSL